MTKRLLVGGTFDIIHLGHKNLLEAAFERGGYVTVGLVSDRMLRVWKPKVLRPYEERKKALEDFLTPYNNWEISAIDDPYQMAIEGDFDSLVVSWETAMRGEEINRLRKDAGKNPLELIIVDPVLADDFLPIRSTRIRDGDIDCLGKRLTPVRVHTVTSNPLKVKVVDEVMTDLFKKIDITVDQPEELVEQPMGDEIIHGVKKRAFVPAGYDYGVGIESGIVESEHGLFCIEYAAVTDNDKRTSIGHGPGFLIPGGWSQDLKEGITLSGKIRVSFNEDMSAIDLLTDRRIGRKDCIRSALLTAMIPRMNGEVYTQYG